MASGDGLIDSEDLAVRLSQGLRDAYRRVSALPADADTKARAARRLIAITNVAKHDLATAARRLDAFVGDLDAGRYG